MEADKTAARDIIIRPATVADAEIIHAGILGIAVAVDAVAKVTSTPDDIRKFGFGDKPAFEVLIAEADGVFAGLCLYFPSFSTWYGRPGVYVQDLYVDTAFRGLGIANKLMRRLAAEVSSKGGTYIRLSVDSDNIEAQRFYRKLGMQWSHAERIFAARGEVFMALAKPDKDER